LIGAPCGRRILFVAFCAFLLEKNKPEGSDLDSCVSFIHAVENESVTTNSAGHGANVLFVEVTSQSVLKTISL
jgi:hypothetical protein